MELSEIVKKLRATLSYAEYLQHPVVKILARLAKADSEIIPSNPNNRNYFLKGPLAKYRRYKQGLQRFRLLFCFSNNPPIIVYLYVNDVNHLRKEGDKNDPYQEFQLLIKKGLFSHNPSDPIMQKWIRNTVDR